MDGLEIDAVSVPLLRPHALRSAPKRLAPDKGPNGRRFLSSLFAKAQSETATSRTSLSTVEAGLVFLRGLSRPFGGSTGIPDRVN
jgi:hypothetical protein